MTTALDRETRRTLVVVQLHEIALLLDMQDLSCASVMASKATRASPYDIGFLMHDKRSGNWTPKISSQKGAPTWIGSAVCASSYREERAEFFKCWADLFYVNNKRDYTLDSEIKNMKVMFDWCDENGHSEFLVSEALFLRAYRDFTNTLYENISRSRIVPRSASNYQNAARRMGEIMWSVDRDEFYAGINRIRAGVPVDDGISSSTITLRYARACLDLSEQLTRNVISGAEFPWQLSVDGNQLQVWPASPSIYSGGDRIAEVYNTDEMRVCTWEELREKRLLRPTKSAHYPSICKQAVNATEERLKGINSDKRSYYYMLYANVALALNAMLIRGLTGANLSTIKQLRYDESFDVIKDKISREAGDIKMRGAGRRTRYPIGKKGRKVLSSHVALRDWVLNGRSDTRLFITLDTGASPITVSDGQGGLANVINRVHRLLCLHVFKKKIPNISAESRKFKSAILHMMNERPADVAIALNHTETTNDRIYTVAPVDTVNGEIASFWARINATRSVVRKASAKDTATVIGSCEAHKKPASIATDAPVKPECNKPEGCLWCDKYIVHSDVEDLWKLLSAKFVVDEIIASYKDIAHIDKVFTPMSLRIEMIVAEIGALSESLRATVEEVRNKVYAVGDLAPYWDSKLQRYEKLGIT